MKLLVLCMYLRARSKHERQLDTTSTKPDDLQTKPNYGKFEVRIFCVKKVTLCLPG